MELNSPRLCLRPWTLDGASALVTLSHDPGFIEFSNYVPLDEAGARDFLRSRLELCRGGMCLWAIHHQGEIIGNVQLVQQTLDGDDLALPEVGYRLRRASWGKGLASEAAGRVCDYALRDLGLAQLYAFIAPDNSRSQSVARKLGFVPGRAATFRGFEVVVWTKSPCSR